MEHLVSGNNRDNFHVVSYRCLLREKPRDEGIVSPFHWYWNRLFNNLDLLAHLVVKVKNPSHDMTAVVKLRNKWRFNWLNKLYSNFVDNDKK